MKCKNCGAELRYDPKQKKLVCDSCHSVFDPEEFDAVTAEEEEASSSAGPVGSSSGLKEKASSDSAGTTVVYHCQSCGAELIGERNEIAPFCHYCGSQNVIETGEQAFRPDKIIPFRIDKKEAGERYARRLKHVLFLPKELKNPEYLKGFRGIYIPYYSYKYNASGTIGINTRERQPIGNRRYHIIERSRDVKVSGDFHVRDKDGEQNLDDAITDQIAPFDLQTEVPYEEGYLAGYYADRPDLSAATYQKTSDEEAAEYLRSSGEPLRALHFMPTEAATGSRDMSRVKIQPEGTHVSLRPAWFLTWKRKDRMIYSVMNGQNGNLFSDLPIDRRSFLLCAAVLSGILFLILWLLTGAVALLPRTAMGAASFLAAIVFLLSGINVRRYRIRQTEKVNLRSKKKGNPGVITAVVIILFLFVALGTSPVIFSIILSAIALIVGIGASIRGKKPFFTVLLILNLVLDLIGFWLYSENLPDDRIYYLMAILFIAMTLAAAFGMLRLYDLMSTHPIPSFTDRKGGRNEKRN